MSAAKGNFLGLTQKWLFETIWRMAKSSPTIFAGDRAWTLGCRYRTCSHLRPVTRMHVRALVNKLPIIFERFDQVIDYFVLLFHKKIVAFHPAFACLLLTVHQRMEISLSAAPTE